MQSTGCNKVVLVKSLYLLIITAHISLASVQAEQLQRAASPRLPYSLWAKPGRCDSTITAVSPSVSAYTTKKKKSIRCHRYLNDISLLSILFFKIQILIFGEPNSSLCLASRQLNWCFPVKIHHEIICLSIFQILSIAKNRGGSTFVCRERCGTLQSHKRCQLE